MDTSEKFDTALIDSGIQEHLERTFEAAELVSALHDYIDAAVQHNGAWYGSRTSGAERQQADAAMVEARERLAKCCKRPRIRAHVEAPDDGSAMPPGRMDGPKVRAV